MNPEINIHLTGFGNSAVVGQEQEVVVTVLREIARRIEEGDDIGTQFDDNGNPVAHWDITLPEED